MVELIYSVPWQIFIVLCIGLAIWERCDRRPSSRGAIRWCCLSLYLLFIGLRGYVGSDWYSYRPLFEDIPTLFSGRLGSYLTDSFQEPGFTVFASALKTVWNNYHFMIFVSACLDMAMLHLFLRRYADRTYALAFLVFAVMGGITLLDLLRNGRSIFLFLLSLPYLSRRRPGPYFALNGLGMLFHVSSIVYLPLYWVLHRRLSVRWLIAAFVAGNAVFLLRIEFIRPLIEWGAQQLGGRYAQLQTAYLLNEFFDTRTPLSIGYLERIVTALLIMAFYRRLQARRAENALFLNAYTLYFFFFFCCSEIAAIGTRLSLLFVFSYWILLPELAAAIAVRANRRLFLVCLTAYAWMKIVGLTANVLYRYDNVLFDIRSYPHRVDDFDHYYINRLSR